MEFLDKFLIIDEIFPLLLDIPTREPAICMAILGASYFLIITAYISY